METLLAITKGNQIRLRKADTMEMVATLDGHIGQVITVCFSTDCLRIASASNNSRDSVRIWDARTQNPLEQIDNAGSLVELEFNSEGNLLLGVGSMLGEPNPKVLRVWELGTQRLLLNLFHLSIASAIFSTDNLHVVAVVNFAVEVVSVASTETVWKSGREDVLPVSLMRHPAHCFGLLATSSKNVLLLRDAMSNEVVGEYPSTAAGLFFRRPCFNSDGSKLAVSRGKEVEIWDTISNIMVLKLSVAGGVNHVSFSSTSDRIAVVHGIRCRLQIFAIPSGDKLNSSNDDEDGADIMAKYQHYNVGVVLM